MLSRAEILERAKLELRGVTHAHATGPLAEACVDLARRSPGAAEVALLDVTRLDSAGGTDAPLGPVAERTVGITLAFDACTATLQPGARIDRLIGPFGVVDVCPEGLVIVEVATGVSGRDLQERSTAPLLAGPSLGPVAADHEADSGTLRLS